MPNTVIAIRQSGEIGNTPSLGVLANGELALNYADGILYYKTASNTLGTILTSTPGGLDTEVQFNDGGSFGGDSGFTYNKTTDTLTAPIIASSNNGNGTNFKVGDDAWIGDINLADTIRIKGQQNSQNAFIVFGDGDGTKLGRSGTGALTYGGSFSASGEISSLQSSGDEGGQINLALAATNTSLNGSVAIDIYQNKFRIFETGGSNRGVFIDMANGATNGVGTDLLNPTITPDTVARTTANAAFDKANSANVLAQAAFDAANTGGGNSFGQIVANVGTILATTSNDSIEFVGESGISVSSNISAKKVIVSVPAGYTFTTADYGFVYEDTNVIYDYGTL